MAEVRSSGSCSVPARSRLRAALEAARAPLLERGYAVVDNALSRADAALLHEEMASLRSRNVLRQHRFGFRSSTTAVPQIYEKPHIFEAELDDDHLHTEAPRLVTALSRIRLAEEAAAAADAAEGAAAEEAAAAEAPAEEAPAEEAAAEEAPGEEAPAEEAAAEEAPAEEAPAEEAPAEEDSSEES